MSITGEFRRAPSTGPTLDGRLRGEPTGCGALGDLAHFAGQIGEIKEAMAARGRDPQSLDVISPGIAIIAPTASVEEKIAHVGELAEAGVTWTTVPYDKVSFEQAIDDVAAFGRDVIGAS